MDKGLPILPRIFIRNDDVAELSPQFKYFHRLAKDCSIPVIYALIPKRVERQTADFLIAEKQSKQAYFDIVQHGYAHVNYAVAGEKKYEFGAGRTYLQQKNDIARGYALMDKFFGRNFTRAFVPPFHGFDNNTVTAVTKTGFELFSAGKTRGVWPESVLDFSAEVSLNVYGENGQPKPLNGRDMLKKLYQSVGISALTGFVFHHDVLKAKKDREALKLFFQAVDKLRARKALGLVLFSEICALRQKKAATVQSVLRASPAASRRSA